MYQNLRHQLDQQLKHLKEIQSTLDLLGSKSRNHLNQSLNKTSYNIENVSPISDHSNYIRNLNQQFQKLIDADEIQIDKKENFNSNQQFLRSKHINPQKQMIIDKKQNKKSQKKKNLSLSYEQKHKKLLLQMQLLRKTIHLQHNLRRYGLKC